MKRKTTFIIGGIVLTGLIVGGVFVLNGGGEGKPQPTAPPTELSAPTVDPASPLVTVYRHGGLCVEGECQSALTIYVGGRVTYGWQGDVLERSLTTDEAARLQALIGQTDFAAIKAAPFTDTCPTAYDGQEVIYTIRTPYGQETLASCQYIIDQTLPLFAWLDALAVSLTAVP